MTLAATSTARSAAVPLLVLVIAGCVVAAVTNGVRNSFGLFTLPVTADLGISRETWALAIAIQNLAWGIAQPFAGAMADKYGTARVITTGLVVYAVGLLLSSISPTGTALYFTAGIVAGAGFATCSFSIIMAAFGRAVPMEKRSFIFGIATAASSFGQFVFAPISQNFIASFGWQSAFVWLAGIVLCAVPLTFALRGKTESVPGEADLPFMGAIARAWGYGSYRLLVIGFFVCGFHLAFISVHLPAYLVQCGLPPSTASWSLAVIGLFNIAGSLLSGYLGSRLPKQLLLASIYLGRAIAFALFMLLPVTPVTAYVFSAVIGLLWLSTVPLTAGLVSLFFGARYMGLLYGIAFLSHQLGSFMGAWLGGVVYDATGSYSIMWYLGIMLGLGAAALNLPIKELASAGFRAVRA
jgi:predicted MFS family arabinose efflux permease